MVWSPCTLDAQAAADLARERADFAAWLTSSPNSPFAAVAQQPIGRGVRLGPDGADIPLTGVAEHTLRQEGGGVTLASAGGSRPVPRGASVRLGNFTLTVDGPPGRAVVTVFGPHRTGTAPAYYPPRRSLEYVGPLNPPAKSGVVRVLGLDGIEVEAAEAGSVVVPIGRERFRLRVLRLPTGGNEEESELAIYFRDGTNGRGSYPAGRFVPLLPEDGGRYRLDFNRARNPFCAYSSAYACPAPWRGNTIGAEVAAGERYDGGGLATPSPADER
jgi:hypothetical protein